MQCPGSQRVVRDQIDRMRAHARSWRFPDVHANVYGVRTMIRVYGLDGPGLTLDAVAVRRVLWRGERRSENGSLDGRPDILYKPGSSKIK
jgi:hypothetical protein